MAPRHSRTVSTRQSWKAYGSVITWKELVQVVKSHIPITPFHRPYPVREGDNLRFARQSLLIGSLV